MTSPQYCQTITSAFLPNFSEMYLITHWPEGGIDTVGCTVQHTQT